MEISNFKHTEELLDIITLCGVLVSLLGVIFTSYLLTLQINRATKSNDLSKAAIQAGILLSFTQQFYGKRMRQSRVIAAKFLLTQRNLPVNSDNIKEWDVVSDLLDFFFDIAYFTKVESLPKEVVYKNYFYWLSFYYPACQEYIKYYQSEAPAYLKEVDWLYVELAQIDSFSNKGAYSNHSDKDYNEFFEWEIDNMAHYNQVED